MTYQIKENETTAASMIYARERIIWGKLVTPQVIRAQTWLKMNLLPDYFILLDANMLIFSGSQPIRLEMEEVHVPIHEIMAHHLVPPFDYEPDYNPDETNRAMTPVTAVFSIFRFEGNRRVSMLADSASALQAGKNSFFPLYNVTIAAFTVPGFKKITVPYSLIRSESASIAIL